MQVTLREFELSLAQPLRTAHGTIFVRRGIEVRAAEGNRHGFGEAAPLPGFAVESYDEARAALGRWADDPEGEQPSEPCAAAAAESALTQLDAQIEGVTLAALLDPQAMPQRRIAVQALVGDLEPEAAAQRAAKAAAAGHVAVKLKVALDANGNNGHKANNGADTGSGDASSPAAEAARIAAVRRALPAGVALRLDANGGWDRRTAVKVLRKVGHLDIEFVEEPTAQPADWAQIGRSVGLPIAGDEHVRSADALDRLIEVGAIEVAVLKPAVLGGPHAVFELARRAAVRGVRSVVSSFICGPAGLRIARDTAVAVDPHGVHGIGTAALFAEALPEDVTPAGGYLPVPTEPTENSGAGD